MIADVPVHPDETLDRLTSDFSIIQKRKGHRVGSDDTLLSWAGARACPDAARILDLGSGKGTVALLLLHRIPGCRVIGVEALEMSHDLALRNAQHNRLQDRWEPRLGDLRDPSVLAGAPAFDLITGAPPFMPVGSGALPEDPQRVAGRFEFRGGVRDYVLTAARHLSPRGRLVILMDGLERSRIRAVQAIGEFPLSLRRVTAILPRPGRKPTYWILEAGWESCPLQEETIAMRPEAGIGFSDAFEAIRRDMNCAGKLPE
jgi:tRNA1Val (adenine37-N6)-methyltransferase